MANWPKSCKTIILTLFVLGLIQISPVIVQAEENSGNQSEKQRKQFERFPNNRQFTGKLHELHQNRNILERYDANKNGKLDTEELQAFRTDYSLQYQALVRIWDKNGNGKLDPNERNKAKSEILQLNASLKDELFKEYDNDNDGQLDEKERQSLRLKQLDKKLKAYQKYQKSGKVETRKGKGKEKLHVLLEHFFDKNHDKKMDENEQEKVTEAMERYNHYMFKQEEIKFNRYLLRFDINKNGKLDKDEKDQLLKAAEQRFQTHLRMLRPRRADRKLLPKPVDPEDD